MRILAPDVEAQQQHRRFYGLAVYLRFRCPRFRRLGEQFIRMEGWGQGVTKRGAERRQGNNNENRRVTLGSMTGGKTCPY